MKLTYLNNYHFFNETIMPEKPTVVQIGLMGAGHLKNLIAKYPDAEVHALEADPQNSDAMMDETEDLGVHLWDGALTAKCVETTLYQYKHGVSSSVFPRHEITPKNPDYGKLKSSVKVDGTTLTQFFKDIRVKYVDLLIMNCEGAELFALNEIIKKKTLREKIAQICVSFHSPRIYTQEERDNVIAGLLDTHHHFVGKKCPSIPDHLFIRKV